MGERRGFTRVVEVFIHLNLLKYLEDTRHYTPQNLKDGSFQC